MKCVEGQLVSIFDKYQELSIAKAVYKGRKELIDTYHMFSEHEFPYKSPHRSCVRVGEVYYVPYSKCWIIYFFITRYDGVMDEWGFITPPYKLNRRKKCNKI